MTNIAVFGATGQQGGAVVDALLEDGSVSVRALVRDPEGQKGTDLAERGFEVVPGDLTDPGSLDKALTGVDAAFAMTAPIGLNGTDFEISTGRAIADAAKRTGLPHLVFSSVGGAERNTGIAHFDSKRRVEEYIRSLGIHASIVRPVFFMENLLGMGINVEDGTVVVRMPLPDDIPLQMIAVRDIGRVNASVLLGGTPVEAADVEIAGDELTGSQIAKVFGDAVGLPSRYEPLPLDVLAGPGDAATMFAWFADLPAYRADFAITRELDPGLLDLNAWVDEVGWAAHN